MNTAMKQTAGLTEKQGAMLRGYVERHEYERVRTTDFRWRWSITRAGWAALMRFYDEKGL